MSYSHSNIYSKKYPFIYENLYLIAEVDKNSGRQWLVMQKVNPRDGRILLEDRIECIHTAITTIKVEEFKKLVQDEDFEEEMLNIRSSEGNSEVNLIPKEKFFAFKSWVAGIAEAGVNAITIQSDIEQYGQLYHPIANRLFNFLIRSKVVFLQDFLEKMARDCIFEGEYHKPSITANLLKILDILILTEKEAWNIWRDQVEINYEWNDQYNFYLIKNFDEYLINILEFKPYANMFLESEKFSFILKLDQSDILPDKAKAIENSVNHNYKFYFTYRDKETGLLALDLYNKEIRNMKKIYGFEKIPELQQLHLEANKIEKIENIEILTNLKRLYLTNNWITKIEGLETLVNLEILYLSYNYIEKIEGLHSLENLKELYIFNNKIKKIEGLENLINLRNLVVSTNEILKIEGLDSLENLIHLNLNWNKITNIENLNNLRKLTYLGLGGNQISQVEGLEKLKALESLELFSNKIDKIPDLSCLPNLKKDKIILDT